MDKILTFLHSGDAGDIVAGLATVKELSHFLFRKAPLLPLIQQLCLQHHLNVEK